MALAACLVFGIRGIQEKLDLPHPFNEDADLLDDFERKKLGIRQLPKDFASRRLLIETARGKPLRDFFGEELVRNILTVHEQDFEYFKNATFEEEVSALIDKY